MEIVVFLTIISTFFLALLKPHWGVILIVGLLPVENIVPAGLTRGIPFFTSPISLLGGVVVAGAMLRLILAGKAHLLKVTSDKVRLAGLLFIVWFFASHPRDAWFGYDRNYVFTFFQLWILLVLAGALLETKEKQLRLMIFFVAACVLSAYVSVTQAEIEATRELSRRSSGLMGGINTAARYYVLGLVFLVYLRTQAVQRESRWLANSGIIVLMVGVLYTESRAGITLAALSLVFLFLLGTRTKKGKRLLYLVATFAVAMLFIPQGALDSVGSLFFTQESRPRQRFQSVDDNIRYYLWEAGFQMWLDNPIEGVGIGRYAPQLASYLPGAIPGRYESLTSHNMFVRVLSETGFVGFGLFVTMIWLSIRKLWRARANARDPSLRLPDVWLIALVVIVAGGLFKDDHADKLFWLFLGVSTTFSAAITAPGHQVEGDGDEEIPSA